MKLTTVILAGLICGAVSVPGESNLDKALTTIQAVGKEGEGNEAASDAWKTMAASQPGQIPALLKALRSDQPLAANWIRLAIDTIAARAIGNGTELPTAELGKFLLNPANEPNARKLAFDLVRRAKPYAADTMIPGFLNDPAPDLRWMAVERLRLSAAKKEKEKSNDEAVLLFQQALQSARHANQVTEISNALKKLGHEVDLPLHFGFLMHWHVVGPFDNTNRSGFAKEFAPEQIPVSLDAEYEGKSGPVKWQPFASTDSNGTIDLNKPCGMLKDVTGYAYTEFNAAESRPAELRLACKNAWKIWFNGEYVFGRDEYHRGQKIDQYILPVALKAGKNTILVKACQNEQKEDWTVEWEFKLRVCDSGGAAILAVDRPPTPKKTRERRKQP